MPGISYAPPSSLEAVFSVKSFPPLPVLPTIFITDAIPYAGIAYPAPIRLGNTFSINNFITYTTSQLGSGQSNLPGGPYLPLSGGTLTGNLVGPVITGTTVNSTNLNVSNNASMFRSFTNQTNVSDLFQVTRSSFDQGQGVIRNRLLPYLSGMHPFSQMAFFTSACTTFALQFDQSSYPYYNMLNSPTVIHSWVYGSPGQQNAYGLYWLTMTRAQPNYEYDLYMIQVNYDATNDLTQNIKWVLNNYGSTVLEYASTQTGIYITFNLAEGSPGPRSYTSTLSRIL